MNRAQMDDNVSRVHEGENIWNLPNVLTMIRLVLVPVFIILILNGSVGAMWTALVVFIVAAFTDLFDGKLARERGLVTDWGKIWDPIADKALTLGAFVVLSVAGLVPWWFTVIVAVRELGITWMRSRLLKRGVVVAANSGGKAKTVSQMLLIVFLVFPWDGVLGVSNALFDVTGLAVIRWILLAIALFLTVWSGMQYVIAAMKMQK
ncbi:CDP-diacylglycerol-glycerol-3-phosphate 3-phosphatidyltransferase [Gleimia europaea ACS-120-V-Col10b]|uniref:CDP-diacylglycerol--glycerol-3-phosphate 3-phosphatidyltransferase n=2 Tax=Gleimia TaxID=2692113 RepID=A0A9W5RDS4_9ACTO|nr:CDP-diacylglycerol-glycerol-3-phosphate 3-phosphatidyltransferase [Gleimia europaea ACS-120-V-Col10b]